MTMIEHITFIDSSFKLHMFLREFYFIGITINFNLQTNKLFKFVFQLFRKSIANQFQAYSEFKIALQCSHRCNEMFDKTPVKISIITFIPKCNIK